MLSFRMKNEYAREATAYTILEDTLLLRNVSYSIKSPLFLCENDLAFFNETVMCPIYSRYSRYWNT